MSKLGTHISRLKFMNNERRMALMIFPIGCIVRLIPELFAYPFPIGYDVINYYMPMVTNFDEHWIQISSQFPLYVSILHLIKTGMGLTAHVIVVTIAILMFGMLSISIFFLSHKLLKVGIRYSLFVTLFSIFQIATLRTTWDLHRDIFAISTMFLTFSLIGHNRKTELNWKYYLMILILSSLTVVADRMIGLLFTLSLLIYSFVVRDRSIRLCAMFVLSLFSIAIFTSHNFLDHILQETMNTLKVDPLSVSSSLSSHTYNPSTLLNLFLVIDGLLVPTGIVGYKFLKNPILKIPLIITIIGSFSWIAFPDKASLVADRWIVLSGIFLSIFAAYGIIVLIQRLKIGSIFIIFVILTFILGAVIISGIGYEIDPKFKPLLLYIVDDNNIRYFVPFNMQFNTVEIRDNAKVISSINWINNNSEKNALIIGDKYLDGFMELYLRDKRTFQTSDDLPFLKEYIMHSNSSPVYLIGSIDKNNINRNLYNNGFYSVQKIK